MDPRIRDIRKDAFTLYKLHPINSWVVSIICALFIGALFLLGIVSELLILILLPLLILPFFFSMILTHLNLTFEDDIRMGGILKRFALFFKYPFNSSFSFIKTLLISILINFGVGIITSVSLYFIYNNTNPDFATSMRELTDLITSGSFDYTSLENALLAYDGVVLNYVNLCNGISFLFSSLAFIFFTCYESITVFIRLQLRNVPLAPQIAKEAIRNNRKTYLNWFFFLNYPLFILVIIGMIFGSLLAVSVFNDYSLIAYIGLAIGISASALYLPFYFSNMEMIYQNLAIDIKAISEEYVKGVFEKYGMDPNSVNVNVEEERKDPQDEGHND